VLAFSYSNGADSPSFAQRGQQAELPGAFKELETLSRLFKNVRRFINTEASKSNFLNNASGYDIIHLAIHGIGDQEVADNSRLVFRGDSTAGEALYAYEIYNLKLDAELIVLSSCESGVGRNQTGEGMFSIARAFTYAGCPSLIISRWQVNDTFTSEIMTYFYENLDNNESISSSLRNAKLKFLNEADGLIAHPANWAAFVVNGQDATFHGKSPRWYWLFVAVLLLTIGIIVYSKKDFLNTLIRKRHRR
jgi:CHAT domain-containing protein